MTLNLGFSPCPNDTYLFYAWVHGHVGHELPVSSTLADIETLNTAAKRACYDVTKLSLAAYPSVWDHYQMLPVGTALSKKNGPKLVGLPANVPKIHVDQWEMAHLFQGKTIAIPGENTTACLALRRLYGSDFIPLFLPYHEILQAVKEGKASYGLLIHETRTHFAHEGVEELVDLGQAWLKRFKLYLPLGGLFIRRDLSLEKRQKVVQVLRQSLEFARASRHLVDPYMLQHAQDKNLKVIEKHLSLYVTQETEKLTDLARTSVLHFLNHDRDSFSSLPTEWIYEEKEEKIPL